MRSWRALSLASGWSIARRLVREIQRDQLSNGAAALAFYMMLALFPAAIFGLSLLPYLPIPQLAQAIFELLHQVMPRSAADLFTDTVQRITSERNGGLLSFGLLFAIWSASTGLYAVMQQLNVVYNVDEQRPFWKARTVALLLMSTFFVLVVVTFGLVIFGGVVQDWLGAHFGWSPLLRALFAAFRWLVIAFALLSAFALTYQMGPNLKQPFRLFSAGNVAASIGLLLASFGFKFYLSRFGGYDATYGSLGAVIALLMWLFLAGWVILIGGEINQIVALDRNSRGEATDEHEQTSARDCKPSPLHVSAGPARSESGAPGQSDAKFTWPRAAIAASGTTAECDSGSDTSISVVVWGALAANVAIAVSKYVVAAVTGSSAMLSEAIHSTADTGNELLLIMGVKLSEKPADKLHPFGRGQEIYFWGLIVAMVLFALGGGMSIYEGIQHVLHPHPIESAFWSYIVLSCALLFEGASFALAAAKMHATAKSRGQTFFQAAHRSKNPQHFVVLFEDAAALLGLLVAFVGVYASHALGLPVIDGVASIVIGCILAAAALYLAYECRSLLLGESADSAKADDIRSIALRDPAVERVAAPLTIHLGPDDVLLNLVIELRDELDVSEVEGAVLRLKHAIRASHPDVRRVFIEVTSLENTIAGAVAQR